MPKEKPPVKPLPAVYAADVPLKPLEKRQKLHKWMEPPDVKLPLGVQAPDPTRQFITSEQLSAGHKKLLHVPLAERTYARYTPGTGPFFGGPTFPKSKPKSMNTASNTVQFVVIVTVLSSVPLLVDLSRMVLLGHTFGASLVAWFLASVAAVFGAIGLFSFTRKPFTRWLLRGRGRYPDTVRSVAFTLHCLPEIRLNATLRMHEPAKGIADVKTER